MVKVATKTALKAAKSKPVKKALAKAKAEINTLSEFSDVITRIAEDRRKQDALYAKHTC